MEHIEEVVTEKVETKALVGIGVQFENARKKKKLQIIDVADKIRLSRQIIKNIETEQWDDLNGRLYARGYIASYADFLGLSANALVAAFDTGYREEIKPLNVHQNQAGTSSRRKFPFVLLVFIGLIAAAAWFGYQQWEQRTAPAADITDDTSVFIPDVAPVVEEVVVEIPEVSAVETITPVSADVALPVSDIDTGSTEISSEGDAQGTTTVISDFSLPAVPQTTAITTVTPVVESNVATTEMLTLIFSEACWVYVKDAQNKTLLNDTKGAGDVLSLSGEQPLKVTLGAAPGVTVQFNGNVFDTEPFTNSGGVARFTLSDS